MPVFPPYSDETLQYYLWGVRKGFVQPEYVVADDEVPEEQQEYYNAGIRQGEDYAVNGYPADQVCYDLTEPHSTAGTIGEVVDTVIEGGGVAHTLAAGEALAAGFEAGILLLMVAIALPTHYEEPTKVFDPSEADALLQILRGATEPLSMEIYFGGGIDYDAKGCQLQVTRFYKSVDAARSELQGMGRPAGILWSVRTDMSGGLRAVEEYGQILD
jgi:hypothetical protein